LIKILDVSLFEISNVSLWQMVIAVPSEFSWSKEFQEQNLNFVGF